MLYKENYNKKEAINHQRKSNINKDINKKKISEKEK